jgi:polyhydroxyalkanoate synthase subunit PhaC
MQKINKATQESKKAAAETKSEDREGGQIDSLARNMVRLFDQGTKVLGSLAERGNGAGPYSVVAEAGEAAKSLGEIARQWVSDPGKLATAQNEIGRAHV